MQDMNGDLCLQTSIAVFYGGPFVGIRSYLKGNCNAFFDFLFSTFSEYYRSISNGGKVLLP